MAARSLFLGVVSGVLAGLACWGYDILYAQTTGADFSSLVKPLPLVLTGLVAGVLASLGYILAVRFLKSSADAVFNLVFTILSFVTLIGPLKHKFPLDFATPELFLGLVAPMHFFPVLGWLTVKPLFIRSAAS